MELVSVSFQKRYLLHNFVSLFFDPVKPQHSKNLFISLKT
jgi:hypothetical protein